MEDILVYVFSLGPIVGMAAIILLVVIMREDA